MTELDINKAVSFFQEHNKAIHSRYDELQYKIYPPNGTNDFIQDYKAGEIDNFIFDSKFGFVTFYNHNGYHFLFSYALLLVELGVSEKEGIEKLTPYMVKEEFGFDLCPTDSMEKWLLRGKRAYQSNVSELVLASTHLGSDGDLVDLLKYDLGLPIEYLKR